MAIPVVFNDVWLGEDMKRTSPKGREVGTAAKARFERDGVERHELLRCEDIGRDGTELPGCLKLYLGSPTQRGPGNWGMVFLPDRSATGSAELQCLAFGIRHQPGRANAWTVYQAAHKRLHDKN